MSSETRFTRQYWPDYGVPVSWPRNQLSCEQSLDSVPGWSSFRPRVWDLRRRRFSRSFAASRSSFCWRCRDLSFGFRSTMQHSHKTTWPYTIYGAGLCNRYHDPPGSHGIPAAISFFHFFAIEHLRCPKPYGIYPPVRGTLLLRTNIYPICRGSSGVEHVIGNDGAGGSIPPRGTIKKPADFSAGFLMGRIPRQEIPFGAV